MKLHTTIKLALCLIAISALVSCGTKKTTDETPVVESTQSSRSPTDTTALLAQCSKDVAGNNELQVQAMAYVEPGGKIRPDLVRIKFTKIPSGWKLSTWDLVIKRWAVSVDNKSNLDSEPLHFQFEKRMGSGFQLLSNEAYTVFNYDEVEEMAEYADISLSSFFGQTSLLVGLKGDMGTYQVLRVQFSNGAYGAVETYVDLLIPTFQADPSKYNADARHPHTLQILHPLKDKIGQSWTENQLLDFTKGYCF